MKQFEPATVGPMRDALRLDEIAEHYQRDGFAFPYRALPETEATESRYRIEALLESDSRAGDHARAFPHLVFPTVDRLAHDDRLIDAVETVLGPDILLWGSGFFLKPPHTGGHVTWHQDLTYWGLDGTDEVAVWLALSPATVENGCMRFVPGSHRDGIRAHTDTFAEDNLLSRGQVLAVDIDEAATVPVTLAPGELSLHHGHLFHASGSNTTDEWRLGLAIQYLAPSMRQVVARKDFAQLLRGVDHYGHFEALPRPRIDFDPDGLAAYERVTAAQNEALFDGSARRPKSGVHVN